MARAITMRADPYTIVIIPGIRGPTAYPAGGFNVSVGQLSKVDYAEVIPGGLGASGARLEQSAPVRYYVVSGSGNIVTIQAFTARSGGYVTSGLQTPREVASGFALSHLPFGLRAYGH